MASILTSRTTLIIAEVLYKYTARRREIRMNLSDQSASEMIRAEMAKMTREIMTTARDDYIKDRKQKLKK